MRHDLERIAGALEGSYRVEKELGSGGMATVFLARDLKHGRLVAIKVLHARLARTLGVDRFLREIEVIAQLQHPHLLTLIDSGEIDGLPYYVMPYVKGRSLADHLAESGPLSVEEAVRITSEIADGLEHAHSSGVVHRDVKPANVLMSEGHAVVSDFGIATALEQATVGRMTETGISLGSPVYMSPEQAAGERELDARSDVYSLGCVTYEMLAGRPPVADESMRAIVTRKLTGEWPPLREARDDVPAGVDAAVSRAISTETEDRFPTVGQYAQALKAGLEPAEGATDVRAERRRLAFVGGAAGLVIIALTIGVVWNRAEAADRVWTAQQLGRLELLVSQARYPEAFLLGEEVEDRLAADTAFLRLRDAYTDVVSVTTDPPGATLYRQLGDDPEAPWEVVGVTPIDSLPLPTWGNLAMRLRLELDGYGDAMLLANAIAPWAEWYGVLGTSVIRLDPVDGPTSGMAWIPGYRNPYNPELPGVEYRDYWMDRFETTNREYEEFVDAGGYQDPQYWTEPLVFDGAELTWDEAMARFVDRTGQPGPSTWEYGSYPEGREDYPVGGVSFYEASAYAAFRGKVVPPSLHWHRAALRMSRETSWLVRPESNLGGDGPWPVGSRANMNEYGLYDVAGNVREWASNLMGGSRFTRGGAWDDPQFNVGWRIATPAFDRSATNGIRLMLHQEDAETFAGLTGPVNPNAGRDPRQHVPVGDTEFAIFRRLFDYEPAPLEAEVETTGSEVHYDWMKVTFDAGYGGERSGAYIFLPKDGQPPYQPILYWPGSGAMRQRSVDFEWITDWTSFIPRSGRALVLPLFKGAFERDDAEFSMTYSGSLDRDLSIAWIKDLRRTVEYLVESDDFDEESIGYYGHSWGGRTGAMAMALEPRIRAAVLDVGGLGWGATAPDPEFEEANYAPRVSAPVLMINGEFDQVFPLELSQKPLFRLLGSTEKEHFVALAAHVVPRGEVVTRSLAWWDRYLGVPRR